MRWKVTHRQINPKGSGPDVWTTTYNEYNPALFEMNATAAYKITAVEVIYVDLVQEKA